MRVSCSLKWLLSTVRAEVDGAKHFARQLASEVSGGPATCCQRKRCDQSSLNLARFSFFNVVLNLIQNRYDFLEQRLSTCFSPTPDALRCLTGGEH